MTSGLIIAAPSSGSGKTTITLALLRHLTARGDAVGSLKVGPDYIDPAFHAAASGRPCRNLDLWAMRESTAAAVLNASAEGVSHLIVEGVMGLFDGAVTDEGSTAAVAAATGWPVVLVVDAGGMAASAAALVRGFATHRSDVAITGVIFNRVGSARHRAILERAMAPLGIPVLGAVLRDEALSLPDRHLGLVQAGEHAELDGFLDRAAERIARQVDVDALLALARPNVLSVPAPTPPLAPPGQRIAVACDIAFAFAYATTLDGWCSAGAEVKRFSPLADEPPAEDADAVFLPGGYPELHAGRLAANREFQDGLRRAAKRGAFVYGECGGYMVLGEGLVDGEGRRHEMAALLPLETSFAHPKLTLGYRVATSLEDTPFGASGRVFRGHEFHFASSIGKRADRALFHCTSASGEPVGPAGMCRGNVVGSFIHLIDTAS